VIALNTGSKRKLLIIEDDVAECQAFSNYIKNRDDIELVGMTNSSMEGINYLKNYRIDAVILDIELQQGIGSGIEFIENLNRQKLAHEPMIVVISNSIGNRLYKFLHSNKIEYIFYKGEQDYSQEKVIRLILSLAPYSDNRNPAIVNIGSEVVNLENEYEKKLSSKINKMLDELGIAEKVQGRRYIYDGIHYLVCEDDKTDTNNKISILSYIACLHKKADSGVYKAIQDAIKRAWRMTPPSELEKLYTAKINYNTRDTHTC